MKKILFIILLGYFMFVAQNCSEKVNPNLYQGIFYNGNMYCPNTISITKSVENGLPINHNISFYDSISSKNIPDGSVVTFEIINYQIDLETHTMECSWGEYVGTVKNIKQIKQ